MMHPLRVLFFVEAHSQFRISASHVTGFSNIQADHLSRNQQRLFFTMHKTAHSEPSCIDSSILQWLINPQQLRLDVTSLDSTVQFFVQRAQTLHKKHTSLNYINLLPFVLHTQLQPPEDILCYFASYLAVQGLSPQTIKVYLAGIHHMQISIDLPDPKEFSSMPQHTLV